MVVATTLVVGEDKKLNVEHRTLNIEHRMKNKEQRTTEDHNKFQ